MGYPMTYQRLIQRNDLTGEGRWGDALGNIRDDLRRLEHDTRDDFHLTAYARHAGITPEQARRVFDLFFDAYAPAQEMQPFDEYMRNAPQESPGLVNFLGGTAVETRKPDGQ